MPINVSCFGTFQLSSSTACWFRQECQNAEASGLSRTALAEALCQREQLSCRAAAQKLLPKLAALLAAIQHLKHSKGVKSITIR